MSCSILRLTQPPVIRLIDSSAHKRLGSTEPPSRPTTPFTDLPHPPSNHLPPPPASEDFLAGLTLSSKPVMNTPVFGTPSLPSRASKQETQDPNAMDWSPTNTDSENSRSQQKYGIDAASYIRPQTFFPREQPTGLEALFERAATLGEDIPMTGPESSNGNSRMSWKRKLRLGAILALGIPLLVVAARIWMVRQKSAELRTPAPTRLQHLVKQTEQSYTFDDEL